MNVCYNVLVLGDSKCGKTELIKSLLCKEFNHIYFPTHGVSRLYDQTNRICYLDIPGESKKKLDIHDLAEKAQLVLIVYDPASMIQHSGLRWWRSKIPKGVNVFVVKSKCDIPLKSRLPKEGYNCSSKDFGGTDLLRSRIIHLANEYTRYQDALKKVKS